MLIFPLKKEWYEKIRSGEKTVEYREAKPYWKGRLRSGTRDNFDATDIGDGHWFSPRFLPKCVLRLGYTKRQMTADITEIKVVDGKDTDLRVDKPVYAIHLANVREVKMKVADVIDKLKQFSPDEEIYLLDEYGDACYFEIFQEDDGDVMIREA